MAQKKKSALAPELDKGKKKRQPATGKVTQTTFPIVGIGASAGGLEALEQFLTHVPENSGMAFVVIQHQIGRAHV